MANKNEIVKLTDGVYQIKYYWLGIANVYGPMSRFSTS